MFKKYYRRALVWLGIQKLKPEKEIIELLKKNTRIVEQEECNHRFLSALFPKGPDVWYKCTNCGQVWIITQAMTINAQRLPELVAKLQKVGKIKKKVMSLKKWQQKRNKNEEKGSRKIH